MKHEPFAKLRLKMVISSESPEMKMHVHMLPSLFSFLAVSSCPPEEPCWPEMRRPAVGVMSEGRAWH